jgi:hypothetical protein
MPEMTDRIRRYLLAAQTLVDEAEVALGHQERGDVQRACDEIAQSADALSRLGKDWKATLDAFAADGVHPIKRET